MSVWVAGISAAVTVGAALYTSNQQKQAAKGAAAAQQSAANQANNTQLSMYDQNRQDQAPWRNAGANSVGYLSYLMGVPGYQNWKPGDYTTQPQTAPDQGAAAGGGSSKKGGWNPVTGFGSTLWSPGGVLGGADGGLGMVFGFNARPPGGGETPAGQGGDQISNMRRPLGGPYKLQTYQSPSDPNFQMLPSGTHFLGPDGVERVKH